MAAAVRSVRSARLAAAEAAANDANRVVEDLPLTAGEQDIPQPPADPGGPDAPAQDFAARVNKADDGEGDKPAGEPKLFRDDARRAIADKFTKNRSTPVDDDDESYEDFLPGGRANQDESGADAAGADVAESPVAATEGDEFTINGKKVRLSREEQTRIIQQNLAGQEFLDQAKTARQEAATLLTEARSLSGNRTAANPDDGNTSRSDGTRSQPDHAPGKSKTKLSRQQLLELSEKIQAGLAEDGADALETLLEGVAPHEDVPGLVQKSIRGLREQEQMNAAAEMYVKDHGAIAGNEDLNRLAVDLMMDEVCKDFAKIGMPKEDIDLIRGNPRDVTFNYMLLRTETRPDGKPWGLRDYTEIVNSAAGRVQKIAKLPAGVGGEGEQREQATTGSVSVDRATRLDAKRGLTGQPSAVKGGLAGGKNTDREQAKAPARGSDVVKQMRVGRHQLVTH